MKLRMANKKEAMEEVNAMFTEAGIDTRRSSKEDQARDFGRIVEHVVTVDIWAGFTQSLRNLQIGEDHVSQGILKEHIDRADLEALNADQLFRAAEIVALELKTDQEAVRADMWRQATEVLTMEKEGGSRKKAITNEDVKMKAAEMFPDEWRANVIDMKKAEVTVEHLKVLAKRWDSRCSSLRNMREK